MTAHGPSTDLLAHRPSDLLTLTVDKDALAHNVQSIAQSVAPAQVMAVVKADGYNHGAVEAANVFLANGAKQLGVATIGEALQLRRSGIEAPILAWIWSPTDSASIYRAIHNGINLGVPSLAHLNAIAELIDSTRDDDEDDWSRPIPRLTIKVDTGLSRSGVSPNEWAEFIKRCQELHESEKVEITGAFTHLACADEPQHPMNDEQRRRFEKAIAELQAAGIPCQTNHMCNSPATLERPDLYYSMVRPGVALYGMEPVAGVSHGLIPAMQLDATVITTRIVKAGESVSYGATWTATEDTATAVISIGYADGLPRALSGRMSVAINGRRYKQLGRVCMDQIVVELGKPGSDAAKNVQPGDRARIFGKPSACISETGEEAASPTAAELAEAANTIHYEILTSPHTRVQRTYTGRGIAEKGEVTVSTVEETQTLAAALGSLLKAGDLVILDGALGAGKTTFTQGLARGMGVKGRVTSPTFTIARVHEGEVPLVHVDAYRLLGGEGGEGASDGGGTDPLGALDALDLDTELIDSVVVAEWGAGLAEAFGQDYLQITIDRETDTSRADGERAGDSDGGLDNGDGAEEWDLTSDQPRTISWQWVRKK